MPQKGGVMDELVEILETHHLRLFQPLAHFPPGEAFGDCYPVEQGGTVDQLIDDLLRRPAVLIRNRPGLSAWGISL